MDVTERKIRAQEAELRQILDSALLYLGVYGPMVARCTPIVLRSLPRNDPG